MAQKYNGSMEANISVRINFGVRGRKPLVWDGKLGIDEGKILGIRGVGFDGDDKVFPEENRWACSIGRLKGREYAKNLGDAALPVKEFVEEIMSKGVELDIQSPLQSSVSISAVAGNFSFSVSDLIAGRKMEFLGGNLSVELIPRPYTFSRQGQIQNYPSVAADPFGNIWIAWVSFSKGEEGIMAASFDGSVWSAPYTIDKGKRDYLTPAIVCTPDGDVWIVWQGKDNGDIDLFARQYSYAKKGWSGTERLIKSPGPDVYPALDVDTSGRVFLCWQGIRNKNCEIMLMVYDKKGWGEQIQVTDNPGNDWEPALAITQQGEALIVWESYRSGLHQILAREWLDDVFSPDIIIDSSKNYVSHASVASDPDGRFWISWDRAGDDWGFGEQEENRTININKFDEITTQIDYDKVAVMGRRGRYNSRTLGLICLERGKLYSPLHDPFENLSAPMKIYADLPKILTDQKGRLWVIFDHYAGKIPFYVHNQIMEVWKVYALYYDGLGWSDPIPMPHNTWRRARSASACIDKGGHLWTAYPQDGRQTGARELDLPSISVSSFALPMGDRINLSVKPYEKRDQATMQSWQEGNNQRGGYYSTKLGTPNYTLYWGSFHDIHDVRGRMNLDGFVIDAFKYARDDWAHDFLGLKDYAYRDKGWFSENNYAWWETQKAMDLFAVTGDFLSFFMQAKSPYLRPTGHSIFRKNPQKGMPLIIGVYADEFSEKGLRDAIEKRRQYIATDKIIMDFWIADHPMGDKFDSTDPFPKMEAKVVGTGKLKSVDILRNAKCIYSTEPEGDEISFTFVDMGIDKNTFGEYHYLLQAVQENGRMAWTPPACLHYWPGYYK